MNGLMVLTGRNDYNSNSPGWDRQFFTVDGKPINYIGFDRHAFTYRWKDADVWNTNNPADNIAFEVFEDDLDNDYVFCSVDYVEPVKKYFNGLNLRQPALESRLIFICDCMDEKTALPGFECIGYDCGYLRGEGFFVLFSCLPNELLREGGNDSLSPFKNKLNHHGLFDRLEDAIAFGQARDSAVAEGKIDGIETAFSAFSIVTISLYKPGA